VMRQYNSAANPDLAEGVASFVEKRPPAFQPLGSDWGLPAPPPFADQG